MPRRGLGRGSSKEAGRSLRILESELSIAMVDGDGGKNDYNDDDDDDDEEKKEGGRRGGMGGLSEQAKGRPGVRFCGG